MTVSRSWSIHCKFCDADDTPGRVCETREEAEDEFERRGWSFAAGEILCEDCAEETSRAD